jgi:3-oxoacyl-(acyl-carrier-protein) synthase
MAIQRALSQKPLLQGEIDVYWAWAPGHREQDLLEAQAVRRVYGRGAFQLYVTASKGATGYLGAASGALEVALAARALREGVIPPAAGCESPDPRVELDIVRGEARRERLSHVMCYSYGLGGHHACIILGRIASNG